MRLILTIPQIKIPGDLKNIDVVFSLANQVKEGKLASAQMEPLLAMFALVDPDIREKWGKAQRIVKGFSEDERAQVEGALKELYRKLDSMEVVWGQLRIVNEGKGRLIDPADKNGSLGEYSESLFGPLKDRLGVDGFTFRAMVVYDAQLLKLLNKNLEFIRNVIELSLHRARGWVGKIKKNKITAQEVEDFFQVCNYVNWMVAGVPMDTEKYILRANYDIYRFIAKINKRGELYQKLEAIRQAGAMH